uniref:Integrase, catalytic region, zinc finger, CCHC-type, peptidase aspartic, catalytic n=1 Tax=Tanacetum cinerariifolium TaxID=118510 RepID=A0A6L2KSY2_TANCI|nr:integrase, catalytic region, zinc finger, CCHC-type, peptidase aspartic, catalytic [Tanacetum cinerariifolium]
MDKEIVLENQNKELDNTLCKLYQSTQAMHMPTKPQVFYDNTHKQALGYQNPFHLRKAQRIKPTLYDGSVIAKERDVISMIDDEETLILEEENFGKRFVTKKELSPEQAFWLKHSNYNPDIFVKSNTPDRIKAPSELPKSQEKDTVIRKLKDMIHSLSGKDSVENVKKDIDEIKMINIELEHSVAKLLFKNENLRKEREHLKSIYKDQFDSIRKTCVQSKEHCDSLIAQVNAKSVENSNLNAQLQKKVFAIAALKNELRKLKGKNVVDTVVSKPSTTIAPGMFKLDIELISHRLMNNRDTHEVYLEKTIENTNTLRVNTTTSASGSKPSGSTKKNRISRPPSRNQQNKVEENPRKVKTSLNKMNSVSEPISRTFTLVRNKCPLTRITSTKEVLLKETTITPVITQSQALNVYSMKPKASRSVVQIALWYLDFGCSKHMTRNRSQLINFVSIFLGTIRFGNDHIAKIMGYEDYQIGNITIS